MKTILPRVLSAAIALVAVARPAPAAEPAKEANGLPLLFHDDFADGEKAMARFEFSDPAAWKIAKDGDRAVLSLAAKTTPKTPFRSPFARALVKDLYVGPFVLEAKLKSTVKDYPHRDLCLFWGVVDDAHEYYAHLGMKPDPHCGNVFLVNDADRLALLPVPKEGVAWGDDYHVARVARDEAGATEVLLDGKPVFKVTDKTLPVGRVGVGSFDDLGNYAEVTVWGKKAEKPAAPPPPAQEKVAPKEAKKAEAK